MGHIQANQGSREPPPFQRIKNKELRLKIRHFTADWMAMTKKSLRQIIKHFHCRFFGDKKSLCQIISQFYCRWPTTTKKGLRRKIRRFSLDVPSSVKARYDNLYFKDNNIQLKDTSQNKDISWKTKTKIFPKTQTIKIRTNLKNKDVMAAMPIASSVARGGYSPPPPPIGMSTKMQNEKNTTFLALLRLFYALEWTNSNLKHFRNIYLNGGGGLILKNRTNK